MEYQSLHDDIVAVLKKHNWHMTSGYGIIYPDGFSLLAQGRETNQGKLLDIKFSQKRDEMTPAQHRKTAPFKRVA
jgi:hypothetical protein